MYSFPSLAVWLAAGHIALMFNTANNDQDLLTEIVYMFAAVVLLFYTVIFSIYGKVQLPSPLSLSLCLCLSLSFSLIV
jgi:hypothetical protein